MQEHTLWKNVVLQNVIDSLGVFQWFSRLNKKYHIEAKDWMGSKVCSYANLEPDFITKIYNDIKKHTHYLTATDIRYLLYEQIVRRS